MKLNRLLFGMVLLLLSACQTSAPDEETPNVLVFLTDDLGYGDLGCYGHPIIQSPNIDQLASEGIRFTDFHSAGTVCSPSRASLLTGRHPYRLGFYYILGGGAHLQASEITLPNLLKEKGYQTFFAGKWHMTQFDRPEAQQPDPTEHGFDYWMATSVNAFDGPESPAKFYRNGTPVGEINKWYIDIIVDEAIEWLADAQRGEQPFFMEICTHGPHTPINPPSSYSDEYSYVGNREEVKGKIEGIGNREEVKSGDLEIGYGGVPRREDRDISGNAKYYYGTVTQIDEAFGRLMKALKDNDMEENTMVVFTSDNGPEYPVNFLESKGDWDEPIRDMCFGSPGPLLGMKRFTTEGGHRVPGIIKWPGKAPAGQVNTSLINGTDLLPTICNLVGIAIPDDRIIDGENMLEAFMGREQKRERPVVWNVPTHEYEFIPSMTMRDGDYLLVTWFNDKQKDMRWMDWIKSAQPVRYELYNLENDIGQQTDLAEKEPEKLQHLIKALNDQWQNIQQDSPRWPKWKSK